MRISVIASLIVAVHLGVVMMVVSPGCATVKRQPPVADPAPVQFPADPVNLPAIPPMPPQMDVPPVETGVVLPPVDKPVDTPAAPAVDNVYVVQKGDSLSKIAARHGVKTADVAALNNITDPNKIFAGQKLLLPAYATPSQSKPAAPAAPAAAPATEKNAAGQTEYVVQRGDALSKIAKKFGVTQAAIMAANKIDNPNRIFAGKKLIIPAAGEAAAPAAPKAPEAPAAEKAPAAPAEPAPAAEAPAAPAAATEVVPAVSSFDADELVGCIPYHTVSGDTVDSIVSTFALDRATFLRINKLSPDAVLEPNTQLFIPPMAQ